MSTVTMGTNIDGDRGGLATDAEVEQLLAIREEKFGISGPAVYCSWFGGFGPRFRFEIRHADGSAVAVQPDENGRMMAAYAAEIAALAAQGYRVVWNVQGTYRTWKAALEAAGVVIEG